MPISATKSCHRVDYEYERHGTAEVHGCRTATVFRQATVGTADHSRLGYRRAQRLETRSTAGAYVNRVCDNLNTHAKEAFSKR